MTSERSNPLAHQPLSDDLLHIRIVSEKFKQVMMLDADWSVHTGRPDSLLCPIGAR